MIKEGLRMTLNDCPHIDRKCATAQMEWKQIDWHIDLQITVLQIHVNVPVVLWGGKKAKLKSSSADITILEMFTYLIFKLSGINVGQMLQKKSFYLCMRKPIPCGIMKNKK